MRGRALVRGAPCAVSSSCSSSSAGEVARHAIRGVLVVKVKSLESLRTLGHEKNLRLGETAGAGSARGAGGAGACAEGDVAGSSFLLLPHSARQTGHPLERFSHLVRVRRILGG